MFADLSELITTFIYEWSRNLCVCVRYLFFENLQHVANFCSGEGLKEVPALSNEIHVMTWATAGRTMSNYITRYDRYYDENGNELPPPPLLDRIPKAMVKDIRLR